MTLTPRLLYALVVLAVYAVFAQAPPIQRHSFTTNLPANAYKAVIESVEPQYPVTVTDTGSKARISSAALTNNDTRNITLSGRLTAGMMSGLRSNIYQKTYTAPAYSTNWVRVAETVDSVARWYDGEFRLWWGTSGNHGLYTVVVNGMWHNMSRSPVVQVFGSAYNSPQIVSAVRLVYPPSSSSGKAYIDVLVENNTSLSQAIRIAFTETSAYGIRLLDPVVVTDPIAPYSGANVVVSSLEKTSWRVSNAYGDVSIDSTSGSLVSSNGAVLSGSTKVNSLYWPSFSGARTSAGDPVDGTLASWIGGNWLFGTLPYMVEAPNNKLFRADRRYSWVYVTNSSGQLSASSVAALFDGTVDNNLGVPVTSLPLHIEVTNTAVIASESEYFGFIMPGHRGTWVTSTLKSWVFQILTPSGWVTIVDRQNVADRQPLGFAARPTPLASTAIYGFRLVVLSGDGPSWSTTTLTIPEIVGVERGKRGLARSGELLAADGGDVYGSLTVWSNLVVGTGAGSVASIIGDGAGITNLPLTSLQQTSDSFVVTNRDTRNIGMTLLVLSNDLRMTKGVVLGSENEPAGNGGSVTTVSIGPGAGKTNSPAATSGTFVGYRAGAAVSTNNATVIGAYAGEYLQDANYSTIIGSEAARYSTSIVSSVVHGPLAGRYASNVFGSVVSGLAAAQFAGGLDRSVAIGYAAAQESTNLTTSVAVGYAAGEQADSATNMVIIGKQAAQFADSGTETVIIGAHAGQFARDQIYNVSVGYATGQYATNATGGTFVGSFAGRYPTNATYSVAVGYGALMNASNSLQQVGIGASAGRDANASQYLVAIGYGPAMLASNTYSGTFIGFFSGEKAYDSDYAIGIGHEALRYATNVSHTMAFGYQAGRYAANSDVGLFMGIQAGANATNADYSVNIGPGAGMNAVGQKYNVLIGESAGRYAEGLDHGIVIGSSAFAYNKNGDHAVVLGYNAAVVATNFYSGIAVGSRAGAYADGASYSVLIGRDAGKSATNSADAVMLGHNAGLNSTESAYAVMIGANAYSNQPSPNKLWIHSAASQTDAPLIYGNFEDSDRLLHVNGRLVVTGNVSTVSGAFHGSGVGISNVPPSGIAQAGAASGQVLAWNGSQWAPSTIAAGSTEFVAAGQNVVVTTNATANGNLYTVSLADEPEVMSLTAYDFMQTFGDVIASGQVAAQSGSFLGNLSAQGTVSAARVQAGDYVSAVNSLRVGTATRLSERFLDFGNSDSDSFINVGTERLYITNALGIRVDGQIEMPSAVVTNTAFAKDAVLTNAIVLNHLASSNSAWIAGTYIVPRATGNASVDTANIQYALDLATNNGASSYGGVTEIVLQPGSYVVNTLYVKTHGTRLRGSGVERTRLVANSSSAPVIDFTGVNGYVTWGGVNQLWWFELADMSIYKSIQPTNQSLSSAVRFRTSTPSSQRLSRAKFSNLRVYGFWKGFDIEHAVGVLFERVEAYGNNYPYWLEKVDSATFVNCFGGDAEDASGVNQFGESYSAVVTYRPNSYAEGFSLLWIGGEARRATVIWDIKGGGAQIIGANAEGIRNGPAILATNSGISFLTVSGLRASRVSGATVPIIRLGPNVASRANVWNLHLTDWSFPHIEYNGANEWMNYAGGHQVIVSNVATARSWYLPASGSAGDGNFLATSNLLVARTIFATNGVTAAGGQFTGNAAGLTNLPLSGLAQSGASVGQVPQWNGSSWVPATVSGGGGSTEYIEAGAGIIVATNLPKYTISTPAITNNDTRAITLSSLTVNGGVTAQTFSGSGQGLTSIPLSALAQSGAAAGQVIKWNGTQWVPATDNTGSGGGSLPDMTNAPPWTPMHVIVSVDPGPEERAAWLPSIFTWPAVWGSYQFWRLQSSGTSLSSGYTTISVSGNAAVVATNSYSGAGSAKSIVIWTNGSSTAAGYAHNHSLKTHYHDIRAAVWNIGLNHTNNVRAAFVLSSASSVQTVPANGNTFGADMFGAVLIDGNWYAVAHSGGGQVSYVDLGKLAALNFGGNYQIALVVDQSQTPSATLYINGRALYAYVYWTSLTPSAEAAPCVWYTPTQSGITQGLRVYSVGLFERNRGFESLD